MPKNMRCKASIQCDAEENKLLQVASSYEGYDNIKEQLLGEVGSDGYFGEEAEAIVNRVMKRLTKPQKQGGNKLGVAQDPVQRVQRLAQTIAAMRY